MTGRRSRGPRPRVRRSWRFGFRACARTGVGLALLSAAALWWLDARGLPVAIQRAVESELRDSGIEFSCRRLHLRFYRGLTATGARLRRVGAPEGEEATADEVALGLGWRRLWQGRLPAIDLLTIRQGRWVAELSPDEGSGRSRFVVSAIDIRLGIETPEHWRIEWLDAQWQGGRLQAVGDVMHPLALAPAKNGGNWRRDLLQVNRALSRLAWVSPPEVSCAFHVDLLHPEFSSGAVRLYAKGARTPAGPIGGVRATVRLATPAVTGGPIRLFWRLEATNAALAGLSASRAAAGGRIDQTPGDIRPRDMVWKASVSDFSAAGWRARSLEASGRAETNGLADFVSVAADWSGDKVVTPWGDVSKVRGSAVAALSAMGFLESWRPEKATVRWSVGPWIAPHAHGPSAGGEVEAWRSAENPQPEPLGGNWWDPARWAARATAAITNGEARGVPVQRLETHAAWDGARLRASVSAAGVAGGDLNLDGVLDWAGRGLSVTATNTADLHDLARWLGPKAGAWLEQFQWPAGESPRVSAQASVRLPKAGTPYDEWPAILASEFELSGKATAGRAWYRGVPALTVETPIVHSNHMWLIQGLKAQTPSGPVVVDFTEWIDRRDYWVRARGTSDPLSALPLLGPGAARVLNEFRFGAPPTFDVQYFGHWHDTEHWSVVGGVHATDVEFRGATAREIFGEAVYTNRWLSAAQLRLRHSEGDVEVGRLDFDVDGRRVFMTNASSSLPPMLVATVLGPRTAAAFEPFVLEVPPRVTFGGWFPTSGDLIGADAWFDVKIPKLRWWKLGTTDLTAQVLWRDNQLTGTNIVSGFHGGRLSGNLTATLADPADPVVRFDAVANEIDLKRFVTDWSGRTNRIDGLLSGRLTVTEGHCRPGGPWSGSASGRLRDGLLWDFPLFGALSPLLDQISPGLGQTRFGSGTGRITISGREAKVDEAELKSPAMRVELNGGVTFEGALSGHLQAVLLRDVPILGPVVSIALRPFTKLFEYDVHGTMDKPALGLRYVPEFLLAPLRPLHWIKMMFPGDGAATNSAPTPRPP